MNTPIRWIVAVFMAIGCCASILRAEAADEVKITFKVKVPASTPADAKLFLAGDAKALGEWKAEGLAMKKGEDGTYSVVASLAKDKQVEYKVTRGSWETVEKNADGSEISNRTLTPTKDATVEVEVKAWADAGGGAAKPPAEKKSTRSGDVREHARFHSNALGNDRDILVYLPSGYAGSGDMRYPVLYLHDGQNVFDAATSFAGEWQADETAAQLIGEGKIEPLIIVAIANTKDRMAEYTPWSDPGRSGAGKGDAYARVLADEIKPFIDSHYRTRTGRADTGVGGSSLGGLISLYIAEKYPDRFGKVAAMSPSIFWNHSAILEDVAKLHDARIWIDIGTAEGSSVVADAKSLAGLLEKDGLKPDKDFTLRIVEGAKHNESAWAKRFGQVLTFLYPA